MPCTAVGTPAIPDDLAAHAPLECERYDERGVSYAVGMFGIGLLAAWLVSVRRNAIGMLILVGVASLLVETTANSYSVWAANAGAPFSAIASFLTIAWVVAFVVVLPLLILSFPDGRLLSDRWRPVVWLAVTAAVVIAAMSIAWPFTVAGRLSPVSVPWDVATTDRVFGFGILAWNAAVLLAIPSLLVRAYRAIRRRG